MQKIENYLEYYENIYWLIDHISFLFGDAVKLPLEY